MRLHKRWLGLLPALMLVQSCSIDPISSAVASPGGETRGMASYYGDPHHGRKTASGERFNKHELTAAHRTLPFGCRVRVTNLNNQQSVIVRINDRGPYAKGRIIDVSEQAAGELNMLRSGVVPVKVERLQ
ncbi:MAG: septal ring lytic transglycosylase RlpA family protein [Gammaproteobacteria bacterium]|nr:septal ring lytic transglycosylase RlpA family protein [Gammaproteobacteria bacterium]